MRSKEPPDDAPRGRREDSAEAFKTGSYSLVLVSVGLRRPRGMRPTLHYLRDWMAGIASGAAATAAAIRARNAPNVHPAPPPGLSRNAIRTMTRLNSDATSITGE